MAPRAEFTSRLILLSMLHPLMVVRVSNVSSCYTAGRTDEAKSGRMTVSAVRGATASPEARYWRVRCHPPSGLHPCFTSQQGKTGEHHNDRDGRERRFSTEASCLAVGCVRIFLVMVLTCPLVQRTFRHHQAKPLDYFGES